MCLKFKVFLEASGNGNANAYWDFHVNVRCWFLNSLLFDS